MEKEEYRGLLEQLKELGYTENLDVNINDCYLNRLFIK